MEEEKEITLEEANAFEEEVTEESEMEVEENG